ncbi:glycosyltransferase family 39 protein [Thermodesulfovibrio yellowstonii]|uniref:glycosyltransferase family 39 protein n=1 Tax=Thermodesulfovibrio yellowstonii TaxID=28262 RepID=UPI003F871E98
MEREVLLFFHKTIANPLLDSIMYFFTDKGWMLSIPVFLFLMVFLLRQKNYLVALYLISSMTVGIFISDWLSDEIKFIFHRTRPCWEIDFRHIVGCTGSYSFPSNHVSNGFTIATIFLFFLRRYVSNSFLRKIFYIYISVVVISVSISRVYLGVHYPSDVIGAALIGIAVGTISYKVILRVNSLKDLFYLSIIVISLFRIYFILHGPIDLSPDEAHYWEWSRRLDLSYYSKGPVIAYLIALSTWLFGATPFGVRIFAVLFSFLSSMFVYKTGKRLFNERVGFLSGILFQIIPLFSALGVIFTIDSPFILLWTVSMYVFLLALERGGRYWVFLGLFIGVGLLTKYTMAFFYLSMILYLIKAKDDPSKLNQAHRISVFKNLSLYLSVVISVVVFLPVIIWNFQHDWVTLKHTAGQAHIQDGLTISIRYLLEFIGSQLIVISPLLFIIGLYLLVKPSLLKLEKKKYWFMFSFSMPILAFFLLKSIQGKVQANWAMTAYVPFIFIVAYAFNKGVFKKIITASFVIASLLTILSYAIPYINLPAKLDPSSRLKGWRELGQKVYSIKEEIKGNEKVIIFSDRYQISSELAFYVKGHPFVYCINLGRRMNQYDLWNSINGELEGSKKVHGIYVVYGIKKEPEPEVLSAFARCEHENFTVFRKNVKIRDYTIFKCFDFKGMNLKRPESY